MFAPVSCTSCGKPFQVPDAALGRLAPCPWCRSVVTALPVSAPIPQPEPAPQQDAPSPAVPSPPTQEPLSLDDDEPTPAHEKPPAPVAPVADARPRSSRTSEPRPRRKSPFVPIVVALVLTVVGAAGTLLYRNYGSGRVPERGWVEFTPPDGSFTVALPGTPTESAVDGDPAGSVTGGKRFSVRGWYSQTTVWVEYNDLDPALVQKLATDRDRLLAGGALRAACERERDRLGGTITDEFHIQRMDKWWGAELLLDTPRGKVVAWVVLAEKGPHPRIYLYGAEAKDLTAQSPACRRLRNSFWLND